MKTYDLCIVGGGPAGLSGAIMASSEGLSTILVEKSHLGGQSTYSPRIENLPGWPDGVTGPELALSSEKQARKFHTDILVGASCNTLEVLPNGEKVIKIASGESITAKSVLLANGMVFKDLPIPNGDKSEARGVCFGSCAPASMKWAGKRVYVVGAANSAAQTALFLADFCNQVVVLVRGGSIEVGMSQYLVERIQSHPKIAVYLRTSVTAYYPGYALVLDRAGQLDICKDCDGLFVFIGSSPSPCICDTVETDKQGFVKADPYKLQTNLPGVFVAGDVRAGSVKRVATAYGDAVRAVSNIHHYLTQGAAA